jgi:hypothetical protein
MISYRFILENGSTFDIQVDRKRVYTPAIDQAPHANWTRLEFNRCDNCPLPPGSVRHCPAAVDMEKIATQFSRLSSFEKLRVEVVSPERSYGLNTDLQTVLRSLLGLVMATSGCPILSQFRGLASFHLPCSTMDETLFRTVAAYLLKQYFLHKSGGAPDWDMVGLDRFYQAVQTVNQCLNDRLSSASENDANLNAIVSLTYVSMGVTYSLEDNLADLQKLFGSPQG